jgi:LETM1 and EF-hand domain-containing protein 1
LNRDSSTWNLLAGQGFFSASPYLSLSCPWNGLAGDCKTLSVAPPLPRQTVRLFYAHSIRALAEAQHQHVQRRFASNEATATKVKQSSLESNPSNNATSSAETRLDSQQADSSKKKGDSNGLTTSTEKVEKPSEALVTKGSRSIPQQVQDTIVAASKAIVSFLIKLPGWTFYYITHPTELRKALYNLWEAIKHEANHYWMGTKLLYADVQTAGKLLRRTLNGSSLTRRERKQLLRTVSDLFRLVPFSMFILIPFMEFALPFALRLFPNMLPSTFQDSLKAEENMKRELQSRIAMAQFFQEYV